jgi:hypothetical protein
LHIGPRFLPSCAEVVYTLFMTVSWLFLFLKPKFVQIIVKN